jgi:tRNA(fMet)-specific endonuclease VapC
MIIADTDVLIDFLAGKGSGAESVARELESGELRTTVITRFELLSGVRTARQGSAVGQLLAAVPALPIDESAADTAAEVRRSLEAAGLGIGMADSLIAGVVLRNGGSLLTRNWRHFERVGGLNLASLDTE